MAKANVTSPFGNVVLVMTKEEALAMQSVFSRIAGCPVTSRRKLIDAVFGALESASPSTFGILEVIKQNDDIDGSLKFSDKVSESRVPALFTQMVGRGTRLQDGLEKPPAPPTKTAEAEHRLEVSFVEGKVWVEASTFGVTDKSWFGLQKEAIRRRKMKNGMNYRVVRVHDEPRYKVERMTRNNRVWCRSILADREYSYAEANEKARDLSGQFTESIYRVTQV